MKTIVTGAAGFIGSHLSKRLENDGYKLILLDDFSRGRKRYLDFLGVKSSCKRMDLRNYNDNFEIFNGVDTVYHVASRIGGNQFLHESIKKEIVSLQDNLAIDRNVFKACFDYDVRKIIFTSSVSVYNTGMQQAGSEVPIQEKDLFRFPFDTEGGYGLAKYIGERTLGMLSQNGTKVGITRIFKSYGPCDDYSEDSGQVVCSLMRKAINYPKEHYVIWGDGSVKRCLVYIDDLIEGIMRLSKHCDRESLTVNLGGNEPYTMRHLGMKIAEVSGKKIQIEHDMSKPVGVKVRTPDLSLAKEKLNWEPKISLEEGLKRTYEWMEFDMRNENE